MSTKIHSTAIVEDGAQLGVNVDVGAFCFVGKDAKLGDNTRLHHHASVEEMFIREHNKSSHMHLWVD